MIHPLVPSLAVAAIGLVGARLGDALRHPIFTNHCKKTNSAVVWQYGGRDQASAISKPRKAARRVLSSSPR